MSGWRQLPNAHAAFVADAMVRDYLLNPQHPGNGGKAAPSAMSCTGGVVVEAPADQPLAEGMIYITFTPPVTTAAPYSSIVLITGGRVCRVLGGVGRPTNWECRTA